MTYQSCLVPTDFGFESSVAGSVMNITSNKCMQQVNHLQTVMTPNNLAAPVGVRRPPSGNGCNPEEKEEDYQNRWSAVHGLMTCGSSRGSLQSSEESQRYASTGQLQMQGSNQCVAEKISGWREETGCGVGGHSANTSTHSTAYSELRQSQSLLKGSAGGHGHFTGGLVLPEEISEVVGPNDGTHPCQSSSAWQQLVGDRLCRDESLTSDYSEKSPDEMATLSGDCCSLPPPQQLSHSGNSSSSSSAKGLSNQLMTKPTMTDSDSPQCKSARKDIEHKVSIQPSSGIISSCLASSRTMTNNSCRRPDSGLTDPLLSSSNVDGHCSLNKESPGKMNMDGFSSNALPGAACLLDLNGATLNEKSRELEGRRWPADCLDSESQSLVSRSFPVIETLTCPPIEPRSCPAVDRGSLSREKAIADNKMKSDGAHGRCGALLSASGFSAFESIGAQVDGCNNGRGDDSREDQSPGVNYPPDQAPLPPPAPPLSASLENARKEEALESDEVAGVMESPPFRSNAAAAATTAVISTCSSPPITDSGERRRPDDCGLDSVNGEVERGIGELERGRGKRKRKAVSYSRYLEPSSSDDEGASEFGMNRRKCPKTSERTNSQAQPHEEGNCAGKTNGGGQRRKVVAGSRYGGRRRSNATAVDRQRRRSTDVGTTPTHKSSLQLSHGGDRESTSAADQTSPARDEEEEEDEQRVRSSLCAAEEDVAGGGRREKDSAAAAAAAERQEESKEEEKESVDTKQQHQQRSGGREKELELEVTNENGEVEIVTIVDLHSSSDEADLLAMNGEDEIIPLSDNESDDNNAFSFDCEQEQPDVSAAAESKMQSTVSAATAAAASPSPSAATPHLMHSTKHKVIDDKGRNARLAGPSHESKTGGTDRTTAAAANKKVLRKKRKRVRPGDDLNEFGSDVEDNDRVHRLKKMFGIQKQPKPVKTSHTQNSADSKSTTLSSSGSHVGPYIRLTGSKDTPPISCKVVNVKDVDLDAQSHSKSKKSHLESSCVPSSLKFVDSVPWICLFCGHGSAYSILGDLFGPYHPHPQSVVGIKQDSSEPKPKTVISPEKKSADKVLQRSPRRLSSRLRTTSCDSLHDEGSGSLPEELWVHEQCAVWTSGVYVARGKLQGLEEAALVAAQVVCSSCHRMGATLGCYVKGCSQNYHYLCAVKAGCFFQEDNFSVLCPKHRDKGRKSQGGGQSD